jgi:hypothetical protein
MNTRDLVILFLSIFLVAACNRSDRPKFSAKGYERPLYSNDQLVAWIYEEDQKQGLRDTLENIILPAKYDYIESWIQFGVIRVDSGGQDKSSYDYVHYEMNKIGLIDYKGNIIFEPQFDKLVFAGYPLALVKRDNKYGYINSKGEFVIDLKFDSASAFKNGFAVVETKGKQGLINDRGDYVVKPLYDLINHNWANGFSRDTMFLRLDSDIMMINKEGIIFEPVNPSEKNTY